MSDLPCDCEPSPDHFFTALEDSARPVFDGRPAEDVVALPDWPGRSTPKRIDEMTLADYRRAIERRWPKRRRD